MDYISAVAWLHLKVSCDKLWNSVKGVLNISCYLNLKDFVKQIFYMKLSAQHNFFLMFTQWSKCFLWAFPKTCFCFYNITFYEKIIWLWDYLVKFHKSLYFHEFLRLRIDGYVTGEVRYLFIIVLIIHFSAYFLFFQLFF